MNLDLICIPFNSHSNPYGSITPDAAVDILKDLVHYPKESKNLLASILSNSLKAGGTYLGPSEGEDAFIIEGKKAEGLLKDFGASFDPETFKSGTLYYIQRMPRNFSIKQIDSLEEFVKLFAISRDWKLFSLIELI